MRKSIEPWIAIHVHHKRSWYVETLGFIFGIMGMSIGITGFVFALVTMAKVNKLEKQLKDLGSTLT